MCRSAVTGDTYDVGPRPPRPSLYRSTSARPPRDSICQLVSGTRLTPGPRSRTMGADRLSLSSISLSRSPFTIPPSLSFSYAPPHSESLEAPIPVRSFHVVGYASLFERARFPVSSENRFQRVQSSREKRGNRTGRESAPVITALVQGAAVTDVGPYPITRDREPLVTPAERTSN